MKESRSAASATKARKEAMSSPCRVGVEGPWVERSWWEREGVSGREVLGLGSECERLCVLVGVCVCMYL